ncbi:hypothetical protein PS681_06091 [Pseudomonas fluorescens]|nr:hypothetical protein PS681_06091 [Pseudomonas fluorescens]
MRVLTLRFQRRLVVGAGKFFVVARWILLRGQAQIDIDLGVIARVLTAFDAQITRDLAADSFRVDPRTRKLCITGTVQHHAVSLDLAVLLGTALQVIHTDFGPGIEAVIAAGLFILGSRGFAAEVAAGVQRDIPVIAVVGGLRRLLHITTLLRVDADVRCADLRALQVNRITAQRDAALAAELATSKGFRILVDPTDIEVATQIAALITALLAAGFAAAALQAAAEIVAGGGVSVGCGLQIELAVSVQIDAASAVDLRTLLHLIAAAAQLHRTVAADARHMGLRVSGLLACVIELEPGADVDVGAIGSRQGADRQRAIAAQAAVITGLAVGGLIQRQITASLDAHTALPAIETAAFELRIAADLDVHTLAAGVTTDHGAGTVLARRTAATRTAAGDVHVFTGLGVDAHIDLGIHRVGTAVLRVAGGIGKQLVSADVHLAGAGVVLRALVVQRARGFHIDSAAVKTADHGVVVLLGFAGAAMTDCNVDSDIRLTEIGQRVLVRHLAVEHVFDCARDRPGDVLVLDVGADVRRPVALGVRAAFAVAGRAIVDLVGGDVQTVASLELRTFSGEFVGIDGQATAALHTGGLCGGFAGRILRRAVGEIDATASTVEAAGVVETTAGAGGVGGGFVVVCFSQQRHVFTAQRRVASSGFHLRAFERHVTARLHLHTAAAEAGALLSDVVASDGLLFVLVVNPGAILLRRLLFGVGIEATGLRDVSAVVSVLRRMHIDVTRRVGRQRAVSLDRRARHFDILGAFELEVAVGHQFAAHGAAVFAVLPRLVLADAEELAVLVVVVAVRSVLHAVDDQRTLVADHAGVGAATHLAAADAHIVSLDDQFAASVDLAALMLGLALVGIAGLAEETTANQVTGVTVVAAAIGVRGGGDFHLFAGQLHVAGAAQFSAFGAQQRGGLQGNVTGLQLAGDAALLFAAAVPVGFPQVFPVVALIGLGVAFSGGGQAQIAAALHVESLRGLDFGGFQLGVFTGRQLGVAAGNNLAAMLTRLTVGLGAVVGFPGDADGAVVPVFALFLKLAAFDCGQGQVAFRVDSDVASADIGSRQRQILAAVQSDIALTAANTGTGHVEAVSQRFTADTQVTGRTNLHAVTPGHLHRAHPHACAFGGADNIDAPGLHRAEQTGVDALISGVARWIHGFHLTAGVIDLIAPDREIQLIARSDRALTVDTRRDQVDRALTVAQAAAVNLQLTAGIAAVQALQFAVIQFRTTDHQIGVRRVDKTAAIHRDAVGVGQHVIGCAAEDFLRAVDGGRVATDHFVEDHARGLALQLRVGRQLPGQLRLPGLQGVVQHQALAVDVVVEELVVRQARTVGRDDVDDGHTALGLQLRGTARSRCDHDAAGHRARQMHGEEQAGNRPAQFAPRGKMKCKGVCWHKNVSM